MEIKLSVIAREKIISSALENNVDPIVRLYVTSAACSGARFGIAFDDLRENDEITDIDGIKFITDTEYLPKYSDGMNVDYVSSPKEGFILTSLRPVKAGCGSGGGCGSGSGSGCGGCSGCKH